MSFKNLKLKFSYRSDEDNLLRDFLLKTLNESKKYYRASGYFSSKIFDDLEKNILPFIENNGEIKLVCGIELSDEDIELIKKGYELKRLIGNKILESEDFKLSTLPNICWLIANNKLELKIALMNNENKRGIYHEKFSVFMDEEENYVAAIGSWNETSNGYSANLETIQVFNDFNGEVDYQRIREQKKYFTKLWEDRTKGVTVLNFTEELVKKYSQVAPYKPVIYNELEEKKEPQIMLREYQKEAIENLKKNKWQGIFAMATGTGKTFTALYALKNFLNQRKNGLIIIVCPYTHLVTQWEKEVLKVFSYQKIVKCFENRNNWEDKIDLLIREILLNKILGICITTISTGSKETFLKKLCNTNIEKFIVFDEVHNIGSKESKKMLEIEAAFRLGLSATPIRRYDEEGNRAILKYFGKVVYEFSLKEAILQGYLAKYNYFLMLCELSDDEQEKYEKITKQIINQMNKKEADEDLIQILLNKRVKIISACKDKLIKLDYLLKKSKFKKTIFYTAEDKEFFKLTREVLNKNGIVTLNITSKENYFKREKIIEDLVEDKIDGILAMRCLDEGADIPEVENAIILASSSNSKQYIQRRGRVLRKKNKNENKVAKIYDYIVIPREMRSDIEKSIFTRELKRIKEFIECAENKNEIILKLLKFSYNNACMKEFIKLLEGEENEQK